MIDSQRNKGKKKKGNHNYMYRFNFLSPLEHNTNTKQDGTRTIDVEVKIVLASVKSRMRIGSRVSFVGRFLAEILHPFDQLHLLHLRLALSLLAVIVGGPRRRVGVVVPLVRP